MTSKRPSAVSTDLSTTVLLTVGEELARAIWAAYGDQLTRGARGFASGAQAVAGEVGRHLVSEVRAAANDAAHGLKAEARAAVGEAGRRFADGLWGAAGEAARGVAPNR
ncbi:hypothetical protein [Streptomyces erythrochromogenes]|uniref:hypothetical protein n=1 Tax=Streptomyces erythrochromogenes TaxID=285574 RepID=UPI00369956F5